jgi:hypothetical protein
MSLYPVPVEDTYDYVTISPADIQVGTNLYTILEAEGDVTSVDGPLSTAWQYFLDVALPDGTTDTLAAYLLLDPLSAGPQWWQRFRLLVRQAKPAPGSVTTAADGSKWIYLADGTGMMTCYVSGTTFIQGAEKFLGELTLDAADIYRGQDADWDWIPVYDPSTVLVGDRVRYGWGNGATVDEITVTGNDYYTRTTFLNSGNPYGWSDKLLLDESIRAGAQCTFMERVLYPDPDAKFSAPDGSLWIFVPPPDFVTPGYYYCWGRGTAYARRSLFRRDQIAGGLTPI